jgi:hypothetical protein
MITGLTWDIERAGECGERLHRTSKLVVALYAVSAAPADLSRVDGDIPARHASH